MKSKLMVILALAILLSVGCRGTTPTATPVAPSPSPTATAVTQTPVPFFLEVIVPLDESVVNSETIMVSGSTALGAVVSVNGELVDIDENGRFATTVTLEEGPNVIGIVASDYRGHEKSMVLTVMYLPAD